MVKNPPANEGHIKRREFHPSLIHYLCQEDSLRSAWQPTPVFLPGESSWMEKSGRLQSEGFYMTEATQRAKSMTHMNLSMKKKNRLTDIENRIVVHQGEGGRRKHWEFEINR